MSNMTPGISVKGIFGRTILPRNLANNVADRSLSAFTVQCKICGAAEAGCHIDYSATFKASIYLTSDSIGRGLFDSSCDSASLPYEQVSFLPKVVLRYSTRSLELERMPIRS
jgi:hypothetical protein